MEQLRLMSDTGEREFFLARSRELRRDQAPAERLLWSRLRNRGLGGIKFRRQHVLGRYIVDFFSPEFGLVVELDGESHLEKRDSDRVRDKDLATMGLAVFRVWNTPIYDDVECVLEGIWKKCQKLKPRGGIAARGE
jgi:very-short-patch-repair endonuclease